MATNNLKIMSCSSCLLDRDTATCAGKCPCLHYLHTHSKISKLMMYECEAGSSCNIIRKVVPKFALMHLYFGHCRDIEMHIRFVSYIRESISITPQSVARTPAEHDDNVVVSGMLVNSSSYTLGDQEYWDCDDDNIL